MNKLKNLCAKFGAGMTMVAATTTVAMADVGEEINDGVVTPVVDLIKSLLTPVVSLIVAVGMVYCVILGVKYAKCEEPQEREKAKGHLKNAVIGFILIFVLMILLIVLTPAMQGWVDDNAAKSEFGKVFNN